VIKIDNIEYSQDEKGQWVYKSLPLKFPPIKKAQYKEKPRYKIILDWETEMQSDFNKIVLKSSVEEITKILLK
jgi:hypothetical protein